MLLEQKFPGSTQNFGWAFGWNLTELSLDMKYELLEKIVGQLYLHGLEDDGDLAESRLLNCQNSMSAVKTTLNCMRNSVKTELKHICSLGISESNSSGLQSQNDEEVRLSQVAISVRPPQMCKVPRQQCVWRKP
uniref:Uncharacterized protein n=1 Tax=Ditylenchus dipsaci TaxID=166011 RepID=A0A915CT62_9BILA